MVQKFELEISIVARELEVTKEELKQEKILRLRQEEELRRVFLRNMTIMNLEASQLFKGPMNELKVDENQDVNNSKHPMMIEHADTDRSYGTIIDPRPHLTRKPHPTLSHKVTVAASPLVSSKKYASSSNKLSISALKTSFTNGQYNKK